MMRTAMTTTTMIVLLLAAASGWAQGQEEGQAAEETPTKMIKMYAENWRWVPSTIRVPQGTRVVIDFVSRDASHSFVLKDYGLKVSLPEDTGQRVEFVADRKGEFRWRCGRPCGDGCAKMNGTLVVE